MRLNTLSLISLCLLLACNSDYSSKKRGYFRVELPEKKYVRFDREGFPYKFEYPAYAGIMQDSTFFDRAPENPYWINLDFPELNARIFISYKIIGGRTPVKIKAADGSYRDSMTVNEFDKLVNDAFNLTSKNDVVASSIRDSLFVSRRGIPAVFFRVGGNAATARQFFMTDSSRHFIRGALYFENTPNADSLKPVVDFLSADMEHLINTLEWKQP
jgi:gliding motility-associated lipoprotein GldD